MVLLSKPIIIAVDGFSSSGKSTLAKALAAHLNYRFVDTGAMYRAVTLFLLEQHIAPSDEAAVVAVLPQIHLDFKVEGGKNRILLNGDDVEDHIREMRVSEQVSWVAAIKPVRQAMVALQQAMGQNKALVMDGRDIGSVVFPAAELKIFVTADPEIRAQRRRNQMLAKGQSDSLADVLSNLLERDRIDSTRKNSPLLLMPDAHYLDNSFLSETEQLRLVLGWVEALDK